MPHSSETSAVSRSSEPSRCRARRMRPMLAALAAVVLTMLLPAVVAADGAASEPLKLTGKAILEHPAGKAIVEAGRWLKAGKAAESRKVGLERGAGGVERR